MIEDLDSARKALDRFAARKGDFADFLIAERCRTAGCARLASFDQAFAEFEEALFHP